MLLAKFNNPIWFPHITFCFFLVRLSMLQIPLFLFWEKNLQISGSIVRAMASRMLFGIFDAPKRFLNILYLIRTNSCLNILPYCRLYLCNKTPVWNLFISLVLIDFAADFLIINSSDNQRIASYDSKTVYHKAKEIPRPDERKTGADRNIVNSQSKFHSGIYFGNSLALYTNIGHQHRAPKKYLTKV